MKKPIVVLGIGELGSVFARAFLKNNHAVYPITRSTDINELKAHFASSPHDLSIQKE